MLTDQLLAILSGRNITPTVDDFRVAEAPGTPAYIELWNEAVLGPRPTEAEIAAVTDAQATDARSTLEAQRAIFPRWLRAIMYQQERRRLGRNPTAVEWQAVKAEYIAIYKALPE